MRSVPTFRQPFDLLAQTTAIAACNEPKETADLEKSEIWLPFLDTYRTMCLAPSHEFRGILERVREIPNDRLDTPNAKTPATDFKMAPNWHSADHVARSASGQRAATANPPDEVRL